MSTPSYVLSVLLTTAVREPNPDILPTAVELAAGSPSRRRAALRRAGSHRKAYCSAHDAVRDRLASSCRYLWHVFRGTSGVVRGGARQVLAGDRHERPCIRTHDSWPCQ